MTIQETRKLSKHLCRLLKVPEVQWTLARTAKGNLGVAFNDSNDEFDVVLDSVKLSTASTLNDENNIELKNMIEKYYFSEKQVLPMTWDAPVGETTTISMKPVEITTNGTAFSGGPSLDTIKTAPVEPPKKRGRPVKNANTKTKESS